MNTSFLKSLFLKIQSDIRNLVDIGNALNRQMDNGSLVTVASLIQAEINNTLVRLVTGKTARICAIRDMSQLLRPGAVNIDTRLHYTFPPGVIPIGVPQTRILKLEMLWLAAVSGIPLHCDDLWHFVRTKMFRFTVIDGCQLMLELGINKYIELECVASAMNGNITVKSLVCESEEIDVQLYPKEHDFEISFDYQKIFEDYFSEQFASLYPEFDLDLGSYRDKYVNADFNHDRSVTVYFGNMLPDDTYYTQRYLLRGMPGKNNVIVVKGGQMHENRVVMDTEVFPFMIGALAMDLVDEDKFRVTYDAETKSVSILPGDPYESDTLA